MSIAAHSHGELTRSEIATYYAARMPRLNQRGHEWRGPCPIHDGKDDNFFVNAENGTWYCHSACGRGGSAYDLEMALTNADFRTAAQEVRRIVGRPDPRLDESEPPMKWGLLGWQHQYLREQIAKVESEKGWTSNAVYPYFEADGKFSYVKVRFIDKQILVVLKERVLAVPDKLAPEITAFTDERQVRDALKREMHALLKAIHSDITGASSR